MSRDVYVNSGGSADWKLELVNGHARLSRVASRHYNPEFAGFSGELVGDVPGRAGETEFVSTLSAKAKYRIQYERRDESVILYGLNRLWPGSPAELELFRQPTPINGPPESR